MRAANLKRGEIYTRVFLSSVMVDPTNDRKRVEKAGDTALFFSLVWQETMAARPVGIVNSPHGR